MAFSTPVDYVGLADTALTLISSTENKTAQTKEAVNDRGDIVAREVFGEQKTPSSDYKLAANLSKTITLGDLTTVGTDKVILKSISIKTSAGKAPELSANGITIQAAGTVSSTVDLGTVVCSVRHKAQIIDSAFTLSGTGADLNECTYTADCDVTTATKEGDVISHDVSGAKATVSATIVQSGSAVPVITAGTNWDITAPLTVSNPDSDYPSWTVTLVKSLESTEPTA